MSPTTTPLTPLCHIVTPVGMLGSGFSTPQTSAALTNLIATNTPTAIILDSGSTDSGPSKLALGVTSTPLTSYTRDLTALLALTTTHHIPLIFSSAGGDGTDAHVRAILALIREIAEQNGYALKTLAVTSGVPKPLVGARLAAGKVRGCGPCVPELTQEDIEATPTVVAQMGPEPLLDAMRATPDFDVLVAGRAYDPAPYVAWASFVLSDDACGSPDVLGGFTHMGKVMECGGLCAEPKSLGAVASVYADGTFDVAPLEPGARCTRLSVAAHTLYEKGRPDVLHGPGGWLDVRGAGYEELGDGRTVRVRGSVFHSSKEEGGPYQVKLEGARVVGWRTMFMGRVRDPILVDQLDTLLERVKAYVAQQHHHLPGDWVLDFHIYGRENQAAVSNPEVFLIGEALGASQQLATSVACTARIATIHASYPGQKATAGNFAFGIGGKNEIELGPCPQFSIYHLMDLHPGEERLRPAASAPDDGTGTIDPHAVASLFTHTISILGSGSDKPRPPSPPAQPLPPAPAPATNGDTAPAAASRPNPPTPSELVSCTTLGHLAHVLRSKNAGPYEITFDVMFASEPVYRLVQSSGMLTPQTAATALGFPASDIVWAGYFDPALAFKITLPRVRAGKRVAAGGWMEDDVHGSQQHLGLVGMRLSETLLEALAKL